MNIKFDTLQMSGCPDHYLWGSYVLDYLDCQESSTSDALSFSMENNIRMCEQTQRSQYAEDWTQKRINNYDYCNTNLNSSLNTSKTNLKWTESERCEEGQLSQKKKIVDFDLKELKLLDYDQHIKSDSILEDSKEDVYAVQRVQKTDATLRRIDTSRWHWDRRWGHKDDIRLFKSLRKILITRGYSMDSFFEAYRKNSEMDKILNQLLGAYFWKGTVEKYHVRIETLLKIQKLTVRQTYNLVKLARRDLYKHGEINFEKIAWEFPGKSLETLKSTYQVQTCSRKVFLINKNK